ncbi:hypothetical protein O3P69_012146 [Scylla paramamosain]|uniref:Uncharacterized protein n=1 Tax=Scylla paramamosain TaxID=85552 RepID=A0AAW0TCX6_SCYPA
MATEVLGGVGGGITGRPLTADDLAGSRVKNPGLLEDWWPGYPVWQGQRDAAVPMVIVVTLAAVMGLVGNIIVAGLLCCPGPRST